MTLVLQRPVKDDEAATHALVIGCGRFTPRPDGRPGNRPSAVAGAREFTRFLTREADRLFAGLASIECLLSDPAVAPGHDRLGIGAFDHDPRNDDAVEAATGANLTAAGIRWLDRIRAGDHGLVYVSSHGLVERDQTALAMLEDALANPYVPYGNVLNFSVLANNLPVKGRAPCWAFLDACQDVCPDLLERLQPTNGIPILTASFEERRQVRFDTLALAAARFGNKAWAPANDGVPYFTQVLLRALAGANVEPVAKEGWVVTGRSLTYGLDEVAKAAFGYHDLDVQQVGGFNARVSFLRPTAPRIPVAVVTQTEMDMLDAVEVLADDGVGDAQFRQNDGETVWRFDVAPSERVYRVKATFPPEIEAYQDGEFTARPCAQFVELVR